MKASINRPTGISIVVNNIEDSVKIWADIYGVGPWHFFLYDCGNIRGAVTDLDGFEIKLLCSGEPGNAVESFLQTHGEGIFSVKYEVEDYDESYDYLVDKKGHKPLLEGKTLGVDFCFIDARDGAWHIMEIERAPQDYPVLGAYPEDGKAPAVKAQFSGVFQIAFVVNDAKSTIIRMADEYGLGPFNTFELTNEGMSDPIAYGKPANYSLLAAICKYGQLEFELIQPLPGDRTIYNDFLEEQGDGLQHIGYCVPDYEAAVEFLTVQRGLETTLKGVLGTGKTHTYIYIDTTRDLANMAELNLTDPEWPGLPSIFDYPV